MPIGLAEKGERTSALCSRDCKKECSRPADCWQIEPDVMHGNAVVWPLYITFDSKWEWGSAGYRIWYHCEYAMQLAVRFGYGGGPEQLDIAERLKVIESAVQEIEVARYEADEKKRELERSRKEQLQSIGQRKRKGR